MKIKDRTKTCGCIICICEDEDRCHGCGAKTCDDWPHCMEEDLFIGKWQPIETAPKDGELYLGYHPHWGMGVGRSYNPYFRANFILDENTQPTHWMPLPEPPQRLL